MKFDDILRQIGESGPYQRRIYFLATIPSILVAFETVSVVFIFNIPQHRCMIPSVQHDNYHVMDHNHSFLLTQSIPPQNGQWDQCHVYTDVMMRTNNSGFQNSNLTRNGSDVTEILTNRSVSECDSWVFDHSIFESTIATDFNVVCGRSIERASSNMFSEVGALVGVFVCGILADRFGRKIPLYVGAVVLSAGGFAIAFTYNIISLNICRFVLGIARIAVVLCGLIIEIVEKVLFTHLLPKVLILGTFFLAHVTLALALSVPISCIRNSSVAYTFGPYLVKIHPETAENILLSHFGMEIVGPSKRVFAGMLIEFMWCIGELLLLLLAYFIRQWRYLEIALSIPSVGLLAYWWLIPESPRWLTSKRKTKEVNQILQKIAASNKSKLVTSEETDELFDVETKLSLRHVLRSRELRMRILIVYSNMVVLTMCYYGLTFNVTNLAGDIFVNFSIMVVVEFIGYLIPISLLDCLGRKPVYLVSTMVAGATCVLSVVPVFLHAPEWNKTVYITGFGEAEGYSHSGKNFNSYQLNWVVMAMSMVGRLCICSALSTIYIFKAELFPTVIRASAMSTGVTVSRVGSLISPYIADVGILVDGRLRNTLPLIIMGTPTILAGLASLWLPETKQAIMPETLEDLDKFSSAKRCNCFGAKDADVRETTAQEESNALTTTSV